MLDDHALLTRYCQTRDAAAFAELVARYSVLVFSTARRITANSTTAEDITQDCFLALARQAGSIHGSLPAWLHRVASHRSLDMTRNEATRHRHESQAVLPESAVFEEPTWVQIAPQVDDALAQLPDELREPLIQHFLLGRTQAQISQNLDIAQATVSRRINDGIAQLRAQLRKAGVICIAAALPTMLSENATAAVPENLSVALAKMAMAGPTSLTVVTSTALGAAKLKIAIAALFALAATGFLALQVVPSSRVTSAVGPATTAALRPFLKNLVLRGDPERQDAFSLAFQAAARLYGHDVDYDTIYAMSTNAFCHAIAITQQDTKSYWHNQAWLGDRAIGTLASRFGLAVKKVDFDERGMMIGGENVTVADVARKSLDAGCAILVMRNGDSQSTFAAIVTEVSPHDMLLAATLDGRLDTPIQNPRRIFVLIANDEVLSPHDADVATLKSAISRIRGVGSFRATQEYAFGLAAMDAWIAAMNDVPGFCPCSGCQGRLHSVADAPYESAAINAASTQAASTAAAKYLRRIAPDFPQEGRLRLQSAAKRYDLIAAMLQKPLMTEGEYSYVTILGDLAKQKDHAARILAPVRDEYAAIARELEDALNTTK